MEYTQILSSNAGPNPLSGHDPGFENHCHGESTATGHLFQLSTEEWTLQSGMRSFSGHLDES